MEYCFDNQVSTQIESLSALLRSKGLKLATTESCTGGLLATSLTELSGSSAFYQGGVSCYSNSVKESLLKVSHADLEEFGAVSEEVARALVLGVGRLFNVDCAISITGVAGPTGGTKEKPVGTVWVGFLVCGSLEIKKYAIKGNRPSIRLQVVTSVIGDFGQFLKNKAVG